MNQQLPTIFVARHGETAWTISRQHTGLSDIPLTPGGERNARQLGERLKGMTFARVLSSPLQRARRTCELAGFGSRVEIEPELVEWNYGDFEGLTTAEIRKTRPEWELFRDGVPNGESLAAVGARADRVIALLRAIEGGDVLVFSSGHFSRVLAARWCAQPAAVGKHLYLSTAALSALGYEHKVDEPCLRLWNDCRHVVV